MKTIKPIIWTAPVPIVLFLAFLIFAGLLVPSPARAHKVIVFAWVEAGQVEVEAGFGGKRTARNCSYTAMDEKGRIVHQGITDDHGRSRFPLPADISGALTIVLEAGPGHKGEWTLQADELVLVADDHAATATDAPAAGPKERPQDGESHLYLRILIGIMAIFGLTFLARRFKRGTP